MWSEARESVKEGFKQLADAVNAGEEEALFTEQQRRRQHSKKVRRCYVAD